MATAGKIPLLGFKAFIRNVVLLGFWAGSSTPSFTGTSLVVTSLADGGLSVTTPSSTGLTVSGVSGAGLQVSDLESV